MKLLFYMESGIPHPKNWDAIQRMCNSCQIDFEYTNSLERIKQENYNILYTMSKYIDPDIIPSSVKAIYGPQFWIFPEGPMIGKLRKELVGKCVFNLPSKWCKDYALELGGEFIMPIETFPMAVDIEKFKPDISLSKEYDCAVYIKRRKNTTILRTIVKLCEKRLRYKVFTYGSYNEIDYIDTLKKSKFMIVLDAHESQGFALQEAMSMNVPLLVLDAQSMYDETNDGVNSTYENKKPAKLLATSVPYWSGECGIKLNSEEGLSDAVDFMMKNYEDFTPRDYVVKTLSAEVCMKRILDYFKL